MRPAEFNSSPSDEAERSLHTCFASARWTRLVAAGRPYADLGALLDAADRAWSALAPSDWQEALRGHPRIGEEGGSSPAASKTEQRGVQGASVDALARLAEENHRYEARFGHVFLIAAEGRSADEILAALRRRMRNDAETEARVAAVEHRKIARRRLERMMSN